MSIKYTTIILVAFLSTVSIDASAQYLIDNAGSSVISVRDPSRQASTDIDAVINNPAGTAFLPNGISVSISDSYSGMWLFETRCENNGFERRQSSTYHMGMFPSIQLALKHNDWTVSLSAASETGKWKLNNMNGTNRLFNLLQSETVINKTFSGLSTAGLLSDIYRLMFVKFADNYAEEYENYINNFSSLVTASSMKSTHADISFRIGVSRLYDFDSFRMSVYLGSKLLNLATDTRSVIELQEYDKSKKEPVSLVDFFKELSVISPDNMLIEECHNLASSSSATELRSWNNTSVNASRLGVIPIIGFHFQTNRLNAGIKYEPGFISVSGYRPPMSFSSGISCYTSSNTIASIGAVIQNQRNNIYYDSRKNILSRCYSASVTQHWRRLLVSGGAGIVHSPALFNDGLRFCTTESATTEFISMGLAYSITSRLRLDAGFRYMVSPDIEYYGRSKNVFKNVLSYHFNRIDAHDILSSSDTLITNQWMLSFGIVYNIPLSGISYWI